MSSSSMAIEKSHQWQSKKPVSIVNRYSDKRNGGNTVVHVSLCVLVCFGDFLQRGYAAFPCKIISAFTGLTDPLPTLSLGQRPSFLLALYSMLEHSCYLCVFPLVGRLACWVWSSCWSARIAMLIQKTLPQYTENISGVDDTVL
jgi:hypothetical protein